MQNFSSPLAETLEKKEETFKVPEMPKRFQAKVTSSPKNERPLRRSTRLSLKKKDTSMDSSINFFEETFDCRRSVRLLEKSVKAAETPKPLPKKKTRTEEKLVKVV